MPAWPNSTDYSEAVQAPGAFFADPDLKAAEAVCGPMGLPVPFAGNFADVYQLRSADGSKSWAVKCFTKPVARLRERYREISRHLQRNAPRLMVDFQYLDQGIRIGGEYFPVLKMDWVEGLTLRNYVEENLRKPKQLLKLYEVWLNVEPLLRKAGLAHGDLQHGNVLLVPGKTKDTLSLRLVDYDGLWVPALKGQPATEVGHPAYQHPDRARRNLFAPEIDLFPHFVIAATLRCLVHPEGPGLWKAFDNGDNLLFRKADLEAPGASPLFKALWDSGDVELAQWAGAVAAYLTAPLEATPRLEGRVSRTRIYELTNSERQAARTVLGKQVRDTMGDELIIQDAPLIEIDSTAGARYEAAPREMSASPRQEPLWKNRRALSGVAIAVVGIAFGLWGLLSPPRVPEAPSLQIAASNKKPGKSDLHRLPEPPAPEKETPTPRLMPKPPLALVLPPPLVDIQRNRTLQLPPFEVGLAVVPNNKPLTRIHVREARECELRIVSLDGQTDDAFQLEDPTYDRKANTRAWVVNRHIRDSFGGTTQTKVGVFQLKDRELSFRWDLAAPAWSQPTQLLSRGVQVRVGQSAETCRLSTAPEAVSASAAIEMVLVPAGEFLMGSPDRDADAQSHEKPQRKVKITRPFYLGRHEVTKAQFAKFVAARNYKTEAERDGKGGYGTDDNGKWRQKPEYTWWNPGFPQTDDHPVVNVSWNDAVAFCNWQSEAEGLTPCYRADATSFVAVAGIGYRLPTEAEWEYACRAGTTTRYSCGNDPESLATVGNVADRTAKQKFADWRTTIAAKDGFVFTAPVGQFKANAFGLHDTHGNVWEWCADWYDHKYYATRPGADPPGPSQGSDRVSRGGGWFFGAASCRSGFRGRSTPGYRISYLGFRMARSSVQSASGVGSGGPE